MSIAKQYTIEIPVDKRLTVTVVAESEEDAWEQVARDDYKVIDEHEDWDLDAAEITDHEDYSPDDEDDDFDDFDPSFDAEDAGEPMSEYELLPEDGGALEGED